MAVTIPFDGGVTIVSTIRNTGNASHTFYATLDMITPTGAVEEMLPVGINVPVNSEATAQFNITNLDVEGNWGMRLGVWEGYNASTNLMTGQVFQRVGPLSNVITVSPKIITEQLGATISRVTINGTQFYP